MFPSIHVPCAIPSIPARPGKQALALLVRCNTAHPLCWEGTGKGAWDPPEPGEQLCVTRPSSKHVHSDYDAEVVLKMITALSLDLGKHRIPSCPVLLLLMAESSLVFTQHRLLRKRLCRSGFCF